jgi:hypothetical protein
MNNPPANRGGTPNHQSAAQAQINAAFPGKNLVVTITYGAPIAKPNEHPLVAQIDSSEPGERGTAFNPNVCAIADLTGIAEYNPGGGGVPGLGGPGAVVLSLVLALASVVLLRKRESVMG